MNQIHLGISSWVPLAVLHQEVHHKHLLSTIIYTGVHWSIDLDTVDVPGAQSVVSVHLARSEGDPLRRVLTSIAADPGLSVADVHARNRWQRGKDGRRFVLLLG